MIEWTYDAKGNLWTTPLAGGLRAEVERAPGGGWRATILGVPAGGETVLSDTCESRALAQAAVRAFAGDRERRKRQEALVDGC